VSQLLILPLPLRSREVTYRKFDLEPNSWFTRRPECLLRVSACGECLELLACGSANDSSDRLLDIAWHCFLKKGDRRVGFFTLMQSCNFHPWNQEAFEDVGRQDGREEPGVAADALSVPGERSSCRLDATTIWLYAREAGCKRFPEQLVGLPHARGPLAGQCDQRFAARRSRSGGTNGRWRSFASMPTTSGAGALGIIADRTNDKQFRKAIADAWGLLAENPV
jgi:hypothetical protein